MLATKYLVIDPEIDNFTYDLANEDELVQFLADALQRSPRDRGLRSRDSERPRAERPTPKAAA